MLYAPTFRDALRRSNEPFALQLELKVMAEELGDDHFLLIRTHYLDRVSLPRAYAAFARDVPVTTTCPSCSGVRRS